MDTLLGGCPRIQNLLRKRGFWASFPRANALKPLKISNSYKTIVFVGYGDVFLYALETAFLRWKFYKSPENFFKLLIFYLF